MTEPAKSRILTWREGKVLRFLREFTAKHGYPPSIKETGAACGLESTSSVSYILGNLVTKGYISRVPGRPRAIVVNDGPSPSVPSGAAREERGRRALGQVRQLLADADSERERAKAHTAAARAASDQADAAVAMAHRVSEEWLISDLRALFDIDTDGAA